MNQSVIHCCRLQTHVRVNRKMCLRHYEWVNNKTCMFAVDTYISSRETETVGVCACASDVNQPLGVF